MPPYYHLPTTLMNAALKILPPARRMIMNIQQQQKLPNMTPQKPIKKWF